MPGCDQVIRQPIARYLGGNPEIDIRLHLSNDAINLIEQKVDLAIRKRIEIEESLVTRKLGASPILLCASPGYIARHGAPELPDELEAHRCRHFSGLRSGRHWRLSKSQDIRQVRIKPYFEVNDGQSLGLVALQGIGIALLPAFIVGPHRRWGSLVTILEDWKVAEVPWHAVYPDNQLIAQKVRKFVSFLAPEFRRDVALGGGDSVEEND